MADNITLPASGIGSQVPVIATDDVGGIHYQYMKLVDGTTDSNSVIKGDNAFGLDVDVNRIVPGSSTVYLGKATNMPYTDLDVGVAALAVRKSSPASLVSDGNYAPLQMDNGRLWVSASVDTALPTGDNLIGRVALSNSGVLAEGNVGHHLPNVGNPLLNGAEAISFGPNPAPSDHGDRTKLYANRHGILWTISGHPGVLTRRDNYSTAQTDLALVSVGTSFKIAVTSIQITADNAMTTSPSIRIGFGSGVCPINSGVLLSHPGLPGGGGMTRGDGSAVIGIGQPGEDLRLTLSPPSGGSVDIVTSYFTIEG